VFSLFKNIDTQPFLDHRYVVLLLILALRFYFQTLFNMDDQLQKIKVRTINLTHIWLLVPYVIIFSFEQHKYKLVRVYNFRSYHNLFKVRSMIGARSVLSFIYVPQVYQLSARGAATLSVSL